MLFREAVIGFLVGETKEAKAKAMKKEQGIGQYCKGEDKEECGKYFGPQLARVCASCPN